MEQTIPQPGAGIDFSHIRPIALHAASNLRKGSMLPVLRKRRTAGPLLHHLAYVPEFPAAG